MCRPLIASTIFDLWFVRVFHPGCGERTRGAGRWFTVYLMVEAEWPACAGFQVMLRHLRQRKRLFACACCRRAPYLMEEGKGKMLQFLASRVHVFKDDDAET